MPTSSSSSRRAYHPPIEGSKRSKRRAYAVRREAYRLAKIDHHMGVPVDDPTLLKALAMRAAFARRPNDEDFPDIAFCEDRAMEAVRRAATPAALRDQWHTIQSAVVSWSGHIQSVHVARNDLATLRRMRERWKGKTHIPKSARAEEKTLTTHVRMMFAGIGWTPPRDLSRNTFAKTHPEKALACGDREPRKCRGKRAPVTYAGPPDFGD